MNEDLLKKALQMTIRVPSEGCPSAEDLYRFSVGTCPAEVRSRLDAHCMACPSCMEAWRDVRDLISLETSGEMLEDRCEVLPPRRTGRGGLVWLGPRGALAAALLVALAGLGLNLFQFFRFRESSHARPVALAPASIENRMVLPARTLDLEADSLALRGGTRPETRAGADQPLVLILNAPRPLPPGAEVQIRRVPDTLLWSKKFTEAPPSPVALIVPGGTLAAGQYEVIAVDGPTGKELERFSFALIP